MHPAVKAVVVHCFVLPRKQDTEADVCRPETLSDWRRVPQKQPHSDPRLLFSTSSPPFPTPASQSTTGEFMTGDRADDNGDQTTIF